VFLPLFYFDICVFTSICISAIWQFWYKIIQLNQCKTWLCDFNFMVYNRVHDTLTSWREKFPKICSFIVSNSFLNSWIAFLHRIHCTADWISSSKFRNSLA
jgi:hypothetical protein